MIKEQVSSREKPLVPAYLARTGNGQACGIGMGRVDEGVAAFVDNRGNEQNRGLPLLHPSASDALRDSVSTPSRMQRRIKLFHTHAGRNRDRHDHLVRRHSSRPGMYQLLKHGAGEGNAGVDHFDPSRVPSKTDLPRRMPGEQRVAPVGDAIQREGRAKPPHRAGFRSAHARRVLRPVPKTPGRSAACRTASGAASSETRAPHRRHPRHAWRRQ